MSLSESTARNDGGTSGKRRFIAIAGNPNCGKTTLFNALTGLKQKVGNYPGVTVEKKEGVFYGAHGERVTLLDLPGTYSLHAHSPDEAVALDVLLGRSEGTPQPELVIAVVDASNLERNLYLVSQLLELGIPIVLALNMVDVAEERGMVIDVEKLGGELGVPVVPMVATKRVGLVKLKQSISQCTVPSTKRAVMPDEFEAEAQKLVPFLNVPEGAKLAEAIALLGLSEAGLDESPVLSPEVRVKVVLAQSRLVGAGQEPSTVAVNARYQWIGSVCARCIRGEQTAGLTVSDRLDMILTHRIWGFAAFLGAMGVMFVSIFWVAKFPMDWIDELQKVLGNWVQTKLPAGDFRSLVVDGGIAGVFAVLVFLPQILTLSFFLGILEDTGYMARAAFLMDRLMCGVGLHGKSFIPMLSSFACAVPGIMAARTIEQKKDRLATILVSPLMSCSARLPVYGLMIAVFLPEATVFQKTGIMLAMYLLGIAGAFVMALLFKRTLLKGEPPILLMEMPPYRMPVLREIGVRMRDRAMIFIRRAGSVILALSVLLWAMTTYPKLETPGESSGGRIENSIAGRMGKWIEPAIAPLGFDWKIGIGLIGSLASREVFVSTMGIVYNVEREKKSQGVESLRDIMRRERRSDGSPVYTPLVCTGLMVFYVFAMQCISTMAVVRRETNSWGWPAFQFFYLTGLAYLVTLVVVQGGRFLGWV